MLGVWRAARPYNNSFCQVGQGWPALSWQNASSQTICLHFQHRSSTLNSLSIPEKVSLADEKVSLGLSTLLSELLSLDRRLSIGGSTPTCVCVRVRVCRSQECGAWEGARSASPAETPPGSCWQFPEQFVSRIQLATTSLGLKNANGVGKSEVRKY